MELRVAKGYACKFCTDLLVPLWVVAHLSNSPFQPSKSKEDLKPNKVQETNFRVPAEFLELYPHHGSAVWLNSSEAEQKETPCRPLPLGDLAPWRIALPIPDTPTDETFAGLRGASWGLPSGKLT